MRKDHTGKQRGAAAGDPKARIRLLSLLWAQAILLHLLTLTVPSLLPLAEQRYVGLPAGLVAFGLA